MQLSLLLPVFAGSVSVVVAAATPTCTYAKATPTPAGFTCEVQGSLQRPATLYTINPINTIQRCWMLCINEAQCVSYGYTAGSKTCSIYTKTLVNMGFTKRNTGVSFAARSCYSCQCAAGLNKCGQNCLNVQRDNNNCGRCGNVCGTGAMCTKGACVCNKPGFLWRVSPSPSSMYAGAYLAVLPQGATIEPTYDVRLANTFNFVGTNVTTYVPYANVTAVLVVPSYTDPSKNPPSYNNIDGTPVYAGALIPNRPEGVDADRPPVSCVATPQGQLSCQNYPTVNKLQMCQGKSSDNGVKNLALFVGDRQLNTTGNGYPEECYLISIDLVCDPVS